MPSLPPAPPTPPHHHQKSNMSMPKSLTNSVGLNLNANFPRFVDVTLFILICLHTSWYTFTSKSSWRCYSQFHQHFFAPYAHHKITKPNCKHIKLQKTCLYEKAACKMLMKFTPDVNFINVLCPAFNTSRSQKHKKDCQAVNFFSHLGSACEKAPCRTLMKLSPDR